MTASHFKATAAFAILAGTLVPVAATATAPGLQITPLQYEDTLAATVKSGHIDVANPTDAPVNVQAAVQGFGQQGTGGDLRFFDDPALTAAIKVDLSTFQLGPRDAIRVLFSVDPSKLPRGGMYAAIFFRTTPAAQSSSSSFITQSANVGTLLILQNGAAAVPSGTVNASVPFWQFGSGLKASVTIHNASSASGGVAFRPQLTTRVSPWGRQTMSQATGLILPATSRIFDLVRPGDFFGLLPLTVTDTATHASHTAWLFACTGWYGWLALVLIMTLIVTVPRFLRRRRPAILAGSPPPSGDPEAPIPAALVPAVDAPQLPTAAVEPMLDAQAEPVPVMVEPNTTLDPGHVTPIVTSEAPTPDLSPATPAPVHIKPVKKVAVKITKPKRSPKSKRAPD